MNKARSNRSNEITMPNEKIQKHMDKETYAEFLRNESNDQDFIIFDKITEKQAAFVRSKVASLPWEERAVIFLTFWDGLSVEEVADTLSYPTEEIAKLLQTGLASLKNSLLNITSFNHQEAAI